MVLVATARNTVLVTTAREHPLPSPRSTFMQDHARRRELRKARLVLRNRLRAYFAILRLYALAQTEEDRRRFSAWAERVRRHSGPGDI
jgi:hypothetical protein